MKIRIKQVVTNLNLSTKCFKEYIMAVMVRDNKKATKIAFNILGTPSNIKYDKSAFSKKIDEKLNYQSTWLSK